MRKAMYALAAAFLTAAVGACAVLAYALVTQLL